MNNNTITRNPNWKWAVTTEDEWYKSAYHKNDGNTGNYWRYPTQSDMTPGRDLVDLTGNNANYSGPIPIDSDTYYYTVVGEFQNSASPYGTFDQGGNVWEWTETTIYNGREERGGAAGYIDVGAAVMDASYRASWDWPWWPNHGGMGFRVVNVPEPSTLVLLALGGLGLLGWAWRKK
jgi:formylglycine-generating enzyme required for sulfatase activity